MEKKAKIKPKREAGKIGNKDSQKAQLRLLKSEMKKERTATAPASKIWTTTIWIRTTEPIVIRRERKNRNQSRIERVNH